MKNILVLLSLMVGSSKIFAQQASVDSILIKNEMLKWKALSKGEFGSLKELFTDNFFHIGYMPDSSINRYQKGRKIPNPARDFTKKINLPPADFSLSDFNIVTASDDVKIISYIAKGPLDLFVSSAWVKKPEGWKTVFYQATAYKPVQH